VPDRKTNDLSKRWDQIAEQLAPYCSKFGDINKEVLLTPIILEILNDINGQTILDGGCGEGFLSRLMAERGATVTAVDFSERLLEIARERTPNTLGIDYLQANLEDLNFLGDDSFNSIVSCLAIQDVADHQAAIQEFFRLLQPGGVCIIAISHPCFDSDGGWVRDDEGNKLHWKTDNYFYEREIEITFFKDAESKPIGFHRTLSNYFKTIKDIGFIIEDLIEPFPSQEAIKKHPQFIDDLRMSHFLLFKLEKR